MAAAVDDRATAVKQLEGLVKQLAGRFSKGMSYQGDHYRDLEQEGICGVLLALERFDPGKGVKFSTYAFPYIISAMQAYAEQFTRAVRISHSVYVNNKQQQSLQKEPVSTITSTTLEGEAKRCADVERIPARSTGLKIDDMVALSAIYGEIINLPLPQQRVILGCFFEHKQLDVVGQELGRTRERVRQLRESGLAMLQKLIFRRKRLSA